jgi:hypothetical protein
MKHSKLPSYIAGRWKLGLAALVRQILALLSSQLGSVRFSIA